MRINQHDGKKATLTATQAVINVCFEMLVSERASVDETSLSGQLMNGGVETPMAHSFYNDIQHMSIE